MKNLLSVLVLMVVCFSASKADTPANCTFDDIRGVWTFYEGPRTGDKQISCANPSFTNSFQIMLEFPNHAIDQDGNVGFWTIIYNQGFEAVVAGRKYFAFSYYVQDHTSVTSFCRTTFVSTSHDVGVNPNNWACFQANKTDSSQVNDKVRKISEGLLENRIFATNKDLFERINMKQSSWRAGVNAFHETATVGYMLKLAGGKNSIGIKRPKPANVTAEVEIESSKLPESFDWRNVNGVNYISPIRNQGECGSCYAFGSMALHEARIRVKSANKIQKVFSTQDIVECSPYSQGCDGGFPYLVAGKYAEDYGIVEEKCNPYKGFDGKCHTDPKCDRYYATNYTYIGGFYGACNEPLMRISLVNNGPIAVSFEVYDDFLAYQGGIYYHTNEKDDVNFKFNPWEITNHVVLIVGYGADAQTGEKYWIVKNSWGESWGESGYFRIRRGTDECSIESIAVEADIILKE